MCGGQRITLAVIPQWPYILFFFQLKNVKNYVYTCVSTHRYLHVSTGAHGSQKRVMDPLEVELHVVLRHSTWVLILYKSSICS